MIRATEACLRKLEQEHLGPSCLHVILTLLELTGADANAWFA